MKTKLKFRTVILSDVHLGAPGCQIEPVNDFLKHVKCDKMILNGDIIDTWQLKRSGKWTKKHSRFVRLVLKHIEKNNTRVVYLRGNHDDLLDRFLPMTFANIYIAEQYVHRTATGDYLVLHGDVFDSITTHMKWLSKLGDIGYNLLLKLNRAYNAWRSLRGKEYFSLSQYVKAKVKGAVNFISDFEGSLVDLAAGKGYKGVICGHIHTAADKEIKGLHYLNSGDWVESLTAIVEHRDGRFEVIDYLEFRRRLEAKHAQRQERKRLGLTKKRMTELTLQPALPDAGSTMGANSEALPERTPSHRLAQVEEARRLARAHYEALQQGHATPTDGPAAAPAPAPTPAPESV